MLIPRMSTAAILGALLLIATGEASEGETPPRVVSAGNATAFAQPDGSYRILNVPVFAAWLANGVGGFAPGPSYPYRVHVTTARATGSSEAFTVPASTGSEVNAPPIIWGVAGEPPLRVSAVSDRSSIRFGESVQIDVRGVSVDGSTTTLTRDQFTTYTVSNPQLATVSARGVLTLIRIPRAPITPIIVTALNLGGAAPVVVNAIGDPTKDSDDDGMPDQWEELYGLNPADPTDALVDADGDGVSNRQEFERGTNPLRNDTDGDGLRDDQDLQPLTPESQPPVIVMLEPLSGTGVRIGGSVMVRGTASDNVVVRRITVFVDQIPVNSIMNTTAFSFNVPLGSTVGWRLLEVEAADAAGNVSRAVTQVEVGRDGNTAPTVNAGADRRLPSGLHRADLSGVVVDDGLPGPPSALTVQWELREGPGSASFTDPAMAATEVLVSAFGVYTFRLTASDGEATAVDEVILTFDDNFADPLPDDRIHLVSQRRSDAAWVDGRIYNLSSSADGRYVVASVWGSNLSAEDSNGEEDIYRWDRATGAIERMSISSDGRESPGGDGIGYTINPRVSADGQRVSFEADGPGLVDGDLNNGYDLFVRDHPAGVLHKVVPGTRPSYGEVSGNGRLAVFRTDERLLPSDQNTSDDVYVRDLDTGQIELISIDVGGSTAGGSSNSGRISSDGRYVAFISRANNLVVGDAGLLVPDVFVRDRFLGVTRQVNLTTEGLLIPGEPREVRITGSGSHVMISVFRNGVYRKDLATDDCIRVPGTQISDDGRFILQGDSVLDLVDGNVITIPPYDGFPSANITYRDIWFSGNGRYVFRGAYWWHQTEPGCTVLVYDLEEGAYLEPMRAPGGLPISGNDQSTDPRLSDDGRVVAFVTNSTDLVPGNDNGRSDVLVCDRQTGALTRASVDSQGVSADADSQRPAISGDGRFVAFDSQASNFMALASGSTKNVFLRDLQERTTICVSRTPSGATGGGASSNPSLSRDGRYVLFSSTAPDLVAGDTNQVEDVFVFDRQTETVRRVGLAPGDAQANGAAVAPSRGQGISADGAKAIFFSTASNLMPTDVNGSGWDLFVVDLVSGSIELVNRTSTGEQATSTGGAVHPNEGAALSADGRVVAFTAHAPRMVAGANVGYDTVYLRDLAAGTTSRVAMAMAGGPSGWTSTRPSVSGDGRLIAYESRAGDIVPGDTDRWWNHLYLHDRVLGTTKRISVSATGIRANEWNEFAALSADGRFFALESIASNLTPGIRLFSCNIFAGPVPKFIYAGPDRSVEAGVSFTLSGEVPPGYAVMWSAVPPQEAIAFGDPTAAVTTCLIDEPGTYILRLTGTKGAVIDHDEVTITVTSPEAPSGVSQVTPKPPVPARPTFSVTLGGAHVAAR